MQTSCITKMTLLFIGFLMFFGGLCIFLDDKNNQLNYQNVLLLKEKELNKQVLSKLDKELKDQIKKNKEVVTQYTELLASYKSKVVSGKGKPTRIIYNPPGKPSKEGSCPPVPKEVHWSYKDFRIEMSGEALSSKVKYQLNQLFKGQLIETKQPDGTYLYRVNLYELNRNTGKIVDKLNIDKLEVMKVDPNQERFTWFNPKLDLHLGFSTSHVLSTDVLAELGASISSYGKTNNELRWRFIRLGLGIIDKDFSLTWSPATYNLGADLPLVTNLWLTPFVGYIPNKQREHFGIGISLVF